MFNYNHTQLLTKSHLVDDELEAALHEELQPEHHFDLNMDPV